MNCLQIKYADILHNMQILWGYNGGRMNARERHHFERNFLCFWPLSLLYSGLVVIFHWQKNKKIKKKFSCSIKNLYNSFRATVCATPMQPFPSLPNWRRHNQVVASQKICKWKISHWFLEVCFPVRNIDALVINPEYNSDLSCCFLITTVLPVCYRRILRNTPHIMQWNGIPHFSCSKNPIHSGIIFFCCHCLLDFCLFVCLFDILVCSFSIFIELQQHF